MVMFDKDPPTITIAGVITKGKSSGYAGALAFHIDSTSYVHTVSSSHFMFVIAGRVDTLALTRCPVIAGQVDTITLNITDALSPLTLGSGDPGDYFRIVQPPLRPLRLDTKRECLGTH